MKPSCIPVTFLHFSFDHKDKMQSRTVTTKLLHFLNFVPLLQPSRLPQ